MKTGMKEEYFMTIAEVSRKYDITADTLRYYEPVSYTHLDVYKRQFYITSYKMRFCLVNTAFSAC